MPFFAVLPVALIALLVYAATKPNTFRIQRSTRIAAPPKVIASHIDDFREWSAWSPYEKLDPAMQRTFSGPTKGVGSVYEWNGNKKAGAGRMEIVEDKPDHYKVVENPLAKQPPIEIKKSSIDGDKKKSPTSIMPKGLLDKLTGEEILDLLAYVLAGGDPKHALFQGGHDHGTPGGGEGGKPGGHGH